MSTKSPHLIAAILTVSLLTFGQPARAEDSPAPRLSLSPTAADVAALFTPQPPNLQRAYQPLRFDEDWRWLKEGAKDHDLFDPIKYIQLGSPDLTLSVGGSWRFRYEDKYNPGFGATSATSPGKNDDYYLHRYFIHTDLRYQNLLRLFAEGEFSYVEGNRRNPPASNTSDDAELHQLFLDVSPLDFKQGGVGLTLRIGRQELLFDRQKLVGPSDWSNARRVFDGVDTILQFEQYRADLFWVRPVLIDAKRLDEPDDQTNFIGAHLTHPFMTRDHNYSLFVYYLNRSRDTLAAFSANKAEFNPDGQAGDTDRVTIGQRLWGKFGNLDYDEEGGIQVGRLANEDIRAAYFEAEAGYTFSDVIAKPRLSLGYDYATGDRSRTDGKANTFDQLFPTAHSLLGYLDLVGRPNMDTGNITLSVTPTPELKLWATWYLYYLSSPRDALYNKSSQAIRFSPTGSAGDYVGNELDLTASYQLGRHTTLMLGYGVFFPGTFINNTGKSETPQMLYASVEFKF